VCTKEVVQTATRHPRGLSAVVAAVLGLAEL
jgi:hypothetical protein